MQSLEGIVVLSSVTYNWRSSEFWFSPIFGAEDPEAFEEHEAVEYVESSVSIEYYKKSINSKIVT